jgi:hypothetical protein
VYSPFEHEELVGDAPDLSAIGGQRDEVRLWDSRREAGGTGRTASHIRMSMLFDHDGNDLASGEIVRLARMTYQTTPFNTDAAHSPNNRLSTSGLDTQY